MTGQIIGQAILWLIAAVIVIAIVYWVMTWLYRRSTKEVAFVRTGLLGEKVVIDGGAFVWPIVHDITPVNMNTLVLEVVRNREQALITRDRMRVDVEAEFYVRVRPTREAVSIAASTLGRRTLDTKNLHELLSGKFESAMRLAAAEMPMAEMHEARATYVARVREAAQEDLARNGLELESVAIVDIDQTSLEYFNPSNRFDAEGLTALIKEIEDRRTLRNDIEQGAMIAIRTRNLAAEKESLDIERASEEARLEQEREIEFRRAQQRALLAKERATRDTEAENAQIVAKEAIERARIANEQSIAEIRITSEGEIRQREIARQKAVDAAEIATLEEIETARILQERALKEARIANEQETETRAITSQQEVEAARIAAAETVEKARIAQERALAESRLTSEEEIRRREIERTKIVEEAGIAAQEATEKLRILQAAETNEERIASDRRIRELEIAREQALEEAAIAAGQATEAAKIAREKSLAAEGQWPWSRFKVGQLVQKLAELGVIVVGFDVTFPEPERNLAEEYQARLVADGATGGSADPLLPLLEEKRDFFDADQYFADSMQSIDVVLGFSFRADEGGRKGALPQPIFRMDQATADRISLEEQQGYIGNVATLQEAAAGAGFFDTRPDIDGIIRSYSLFMRFQNRLYPSIALDMARLYNLEPDFTPEIERDLTGNYQQLRGIRMSRTLIPTDEEGRVLVPYIGPSFSYPYISATDVLHGNLTSEQEDLLFNSLVLVGTTAVGLYDLRSTPVQAVYPGVEVHANVLNAILSAPPSITIGAETQEQGTLSALRDVFDQGKISPFPSRPDWEKGAVYVAIIVIGLMLSLIYPHLGPALLAISSVTFLLGLTVLNFQMWSLYNLDISLVILWLLIILIATVNMTYGFLKEGLNKKVIKGMFDQYVPPAHIDAMLNNPDKYNFAGENKELSVLFSDIRNFTTISEKLTAVELKSMLNEFFTPITGIIFEHNGTIDKYVGDMVMAFWGAPLDDPEHRTHAVQAALKMLAKVEALKPVFKEKGLPEVNIGVGINSGMMSVGDMGSTYRRSYTVLGDAVNLGSRLEGITKAYGVKLLIGEQTHAGLNGILCRQVDKVQVKGKEEPICIYQPLCMEAEASSELKARVEEYHRAYAHYLRQEWDAAEPLFQELQRLDPETQLYGIYLQRIAELRRKNLPENWDGTYRHTSK